jgi:hypothetical protein
LLISLLFFFVLQSSGNGSPGKMQAAEADSLESCVFALFNEIIGSLNKDISEVLRLKTSEVASSVSNFQSAVTMKTSEIGTLFIESPFILNIPSNTLWFFTFAFGPPFHFSPHLQSNSRRTPAQSWQPLRLLCKSSKTALQASLEPFPPTKSVSIVSIVLFDGMNGPPAVPLTLAGYLATSAGGACKNRN